MNWWRKEEEDNEKKVHTERMKEWLLGFYILLIDVISINISWVFYYLKKKILLIVEFLMNLLSVAAICANKGKFYSSEWINK